MSNIKEKIDLIDTTKLSVAHINKKKSTVVLYNDNTTEFGFVVAILNQLFNLSQTDAVNTATSAQSAGSVTVGEYSEDYATRQVANAMMVARNNNFPDFRIECVNN